MRKANNATYEDLLTQVTKDPDNIDIQLIFGETCLTSGKLDKAEKAFKHVLDMDDKFSTEEQLNLRLLQIFRKGNPYDWNMKTRKALHYLGWVYEKQGNHKLAEEYILDAFYGANDTWFFFNTGKFYLESSSSDIEAAVKLFMDAVDRDDSLIVACDDLLKNFIKHNKLFSLDSPPEMIEIYIRIWETHKIRKLS